MRPAEYLEGLKLEGGWTIGPIVHRPPTATGGHFSVGYSVTHSNGDKAFLKALDFSAALQNPDPARELQAMTTAYNFERDLLERCKRRALGRIATPIADGVAIAPGAWGAVAAVPYLIFEIADGDLRGIVAQQQALDLAWALRTLHQTSVGLRQLHSVGIAHQDLKPSNVLLFAEFGARVADLGRSAHITTASALDHWQTPGDVGYAPPEQVYGWRVSPEFYHRFLADLYHLGSMLHFLFTGLATTQALALKLSQTHNKGFTRSEFRNDLPYLIQAFSDVLQDFAATASAQGGPMADELVLIASELCHPDPCLRGDPRARASIRPQHDLQAYVSRFDRLAARVELGFK